MGEERWAAYRAIWPSEAELADMLPVFWEAPRLETLAARFPGLSAQVTSRRRLLRDAAKHLGLCSEEGTEDSEAVRRLRRAHALVSTRAVGAGIDACAMLPGIDMANHDADPNAELVVAGEPGVATGRATVTSRGDIWEHGTAGLVAKRDIAAGEAVRISYGSYPNQRLLLDYGFELGEDNLSGDREEEEEESQKTSGGGELGGAGAWDRAD